MKILKKWNGFKSYIVHVTFYINKYNHKCYRERWSEFSSLQPQPKAQMNNLLTVFSHI